MKISQIFFPNVPVINKSALVQAMAYKQQSTLWTDDSVNSLAPGKFEWNFGHLIRQIISVIDGWVISGELALRWMSLDLTDNKSTLVQVMACCRQATSHYLSQCWPRSLSPYGITRPQWVNSSPPGQNGHHFIDDIFMNEKFCISIRVSLKFVPKGPTDNKSAMVQVMANRHQAITRTNADPVHWCIYAVLVGDELTEVHVCTTRAQCVKRKNKATRKSMPFNQSCM